MYSYEIVFASTGIMRVSMKCPTPPPPSRVWVGICQYVSIVRVYTDVPPARAKCLGESTCMHGPKPPAAMLKPQMSIASRVQNEQMPHPWGGAFWKMTLKPPPCPVRGGGRGSGAFHKLDYCG
jgi:hypothetical protein